MDRLRQWITCTAWQCQPIHHGLTTFLGLSFLLLFASCAQLDQLMGTQAASVEPKEQNTKSAPGASAHKKSSQASSHPEADSKQADRDKALAEKNQLTKENKSRVASDRKSTKKPAKSQAEPQAPTEDIFLSPVPLPTKPAAIGGSGG